MSDGRQDRERIGGPMRRRGALALSSDDQTVVAMVLAIKAITLGFGAFCFAITENQRLGSLARLLEIWNRWDGPHYLDIARSGYGAAGEARLRLVFYPLYPLLVRLFAAGLHSPLLVSAFVVSGVASLVLAVVFRRLMAIDYPGRTAAAAVWFLFIFPTAYFFHIDYTESLFLALVAASFLAARRDRWPEAGGFAALASLTHDTGVLLVPALAAEAAHRFWLTRRWQNRWLWIGLVPAGFALYLFINYRATGDPFAFLRIASEHWTDRLTTPWVGIRETIGVLAWMDPRNAGMIGLQVLVFIVLGLAATIASIALLRPSYAVWMAGNWLVFASQSWDLSAPRLMLAMFPLFILAALLARSRLWNAVLTTWCLLFMGVFISEFVQGHWAF